MSEQKKKVSLQKHKETKIDNDDDDDDTQHTHKWTSKISKSDAIAKM